MQFNRFKAYNLLVFLTNMNMIEKMIQMMIKTQMKKGLMLLCQMGILSNSVSSKKIRKIELRITQLNRFTTITHKNRAEFIFD